MKITVSSKDKSKVFDDSKIIRIGTTPECRFKPDVNFEFAISISKVADGQYKIKNLTGTDRILFRGQPLGPSLQMGTLCKLMFEGSEDFVMIKVSEGGTNPKVVPGSIETANKKQAEKAAKTETKTMAAIAGEDLNTQDIEALYGSGKGAYTKIKIDQRKAEIERRRAIITKEIAYKANYLRAKLSQNEILLSFLNFFIVVVPLLFAYVLNDIMSLEVKPAAAAAATSAVKTVSGVQLQTRLMFLIAIGMIILTLLLKQGQFLTLQLKKTGLKSSSTVLVRNVSMIVSGGLFSCIIIRGIAEFLKGGSTWLIPGMAVICSALCIVIGVFAGFTQNSVAETGEELDGYESREDFQSVIKDYQQWISLFVNNITKKKLKDISNKIFNLQIKSGGEYLMGILTAPFLAYGVSQTLAECFPEAAGWIRLTDAFKISPVFLTLATLMIVFAFHCFATSFAISKRINASNIIKQDGFSDYNVHGVIIHGVESSKNLRKEAKKFFIVAVCVVLIEISMNVSYFIGVMGGDVWGMIKSFIAAFVPTAILIMETTMLGNTKFDIIIKEELLDKVDKEF